MDLAHRLVPVDSGRAGGTGGEVVGEVIDRARDAGAIRAAVTVEEVCLLIRGLARASATSPTPPGTLRRAIDVVLAGLAP